jgi:predicted metalloendopeptidase
MPPAIPWARYFAVVGNPNARAVNVTAPTYMKAASGILKNESIEALRSFLLWRWIHAMAPYLPTAFADKHYEFAAESLTNSAE